MIALVDGDVLRYMIGFACQGTYYKVGDYEFDAKADAKIYVQENNLDASLIIQGIAPESEHVVISTLETMLNRIKIDCQADDLQIYLSGKGNFREKIAVTTKYKGSRADSVKPYHYPTISKHLLEQHGAILVEGQEADDALGIAQFTDHLMSSSKQDLDTVICSIDKDLRMIPGWHYNLTHNRIEYVSEEEALINFYKQLLTGDSTDDIIGLKGIGPAKAEKILGGCTTEAQLIHAVGMAYATAKDMEPDPEARLLENGRLLWIRRIPDELWEIPDTSSPF